MAAISTYAANAQLSHLTGKAAFSMPTNYLALLRATAGQSPRSTAVTSGQTTIPASPNGLLYRCTTAGTTGSGEPSWTTVAGGTVSDGGTVVWTEMTPDLKVNNAYVTAIEANFTGYARGTTSAASWNAASGGSITAAAAVACGTTSTSVTAQVIVGTYAYDAATVGNPLWWEIASSSTGVMSVGTNISATTLPTVNQS